MITDEMIPAMQGAIPSTIASCSEDGIPNVTFISQAFYVDENHIALSFQFFNKTIKNVRANKQASLLITNPMSYDTYTLQIEFDHTEEDGELYDEMEMQLDAIASMTGMGDVFNLRGADVYRVVEVKKNSEEKS